MDITPILQMVLDFISKLVPEKTGTRFLLAMSAIFAVVYMAFKEIGTDMHLYLIGGMWAFYCVTELIRRMIEKEKKT